MVKRRSKKQIVSDDFSWRFCSDESYELPVELSEALTKLGLSKHLELVREEIDSALYMKDVDVFRSTVSRSEVLKNLESARKQAAQLMLSLFSPAEITEAAKLRKLPDKWLHGIQSKFRCAVFGESSREPLYDRNLLDSLIGLFLSSDYMLSALKKNSRTGPMKCFYPQRLVDRLAVRFGMAGLKPTSNKPGRSMRCFNFIAVTEAIFDALDLPHADVQKRVTIALSKLRSSIPTHLEQN